MTEHDRAEDFMRDVDALLRGEAPASADAEHLAMLGIARDLIASDLSAEAPLDALRPLPPTLTLKGRLMSPRYRSLRWFVATAAVFTLLAAAFLTVPPLRALAQDILRRIGIYNVTDAPTDRDLRAQPLPVIQMARGGSASWTITRAQIENDFNWLALLDIPPGFDSVTYVYETEPDLLFGYASAKYTRGGDPATELEFNQMQRFIGDRELDFLTGGAQAEAVEVNGRPGYWVAGFAQAPDVDVQMLIWTGEVYGQRDALLLWLTGRGSTKDAMLEIARAVTVRDPLDIRQPVVAADALRRNDVPPSHIAAEVGFDVAVPQYIPERMRLAWRYHTGDEDFGESSVGYTGWIETADGLRAADFNIHQTKAKTAAQQPYEFALGSTPFEDVTVNGQAGVWVPDAALYYDEQKNYLLWEQEGSSFMLSASTNVPREEMFRIAESLVFVGPDATDPVAQAAYEGKLLPAEIVAFQSGFPVAVPDAVPDGYVLRSRDARRMSEVAAATTTYTAEKDTLVLIQSKYPAAIRVRDLALGDAWLEDVTVNRREGFWVANYQTYPDDRIGLLIWEQGGFIYKLQSAALGKDELIAIAESLKYVGAGD